MNKALEKGPRRENDSLGAPASARGPNKSNDLTILHQQVFDTIFYDLEIIGVSQYVLDRFTIETSISLSPRPPYSGSPRSVQHSKLDAGSISRRPHDTVQSVDLADEVSLPQTSDSGVAGHLSDGGGTMSDQDGFGAHAGGGGRCLGAGMPSAHHDHVKRIHDSALSRL
jgi:hypothetical protein